MSIHDATLAMVDTLNRLGIDYLLVGSLAASFHGLARSTTDADFVVELGSHQLSEVVALLGPGYSLEPQAAFEVFTGKRVQVIYVVGTHFKIDVFPLSHDAFDQERFRRRIRGRLYEREVLVPSAEDVIVVKLRWGRALDLEDAKYIASLQAQSLDWSYIERWCDAQGTREVLEKLRRETPTLP